MRRLLAAAVLLTLCRPAAAAQAPRSRPGPAVLPLFANEKRLQGPVDLAEKTRALSDVLAELSRQTKVKLTALRPAADEKATLFITERPAGEVLTRLARHFDYQWRKRGDGYELSQDLVSQRREAALRDSQLRQHIAAIQERLRALLPLADLGRDQLRARSEEVRAVLGSTASTQQERQRAGEEMSLLQDLLRPGASQALRILGSLPAGHLDRLWSGAEIRLSTTDGTLPKALADQVHEASRHLGGNFVTLGGPGGASLEPTRPADPPTGATVTLTLSSSGPVRAMSRGGRVPSLQVLMESLSAPAATAPPQPGLRAVPARRLPVIWTPAVRPAGPGPKPARPEDPALQRAVTLKLAPKPAAVASPLLPPGVAPGRVPLADVLEKLHTASGMDIVSDAYIRARLDPAQVSGEKPIQQILSTIAAIEYDWERQDTLLLLKSDRWFHDRPEEVPDRLLRPWQARVARAGSPSLDDLADLATRLTDYQTYSLEEHWPFYLEEPVIPSPLRPGIHESRQHLRFWAALTPAQKAQARSEIVPVARMSRVQATAFAIALTAPQPGRWMSGPSEQGASNAEIATGGFSLKASQVQQQAYGATTGDGQQVRLQTIQPLGTPPAGAPRIGNQELNIQPLGPAEILDSYSFNYYLRGESTPSRTANLNLPVKK